MVPLVQQRQQNGIHLLEEDRDQGVFGLRFDRMAGYCRTHVEVNKTRSPSCNCWQSLFHDSYEFRYRREIFRTDCNADPRAWKRGKAFEPRGWSRWLKDGTQSGVGEATADPSAV